MSRAAVIAKVGWWLAIGLIGASVPAAAVADTYKVDGVHSSVVFKIKHTDISYIYGMFKRVSGTFTHEPGGSIDVRVNVESIDTGNPIRDGHLKSPDYFSAKQYPTIRFQSDDVTSAGDGVLEANGQVTMHGISQPLAATIHITGTGRGQMGEARGGIEAELVVKRSEFRLGAAAGLSDEVRVFVSLQGVKQ